MKTHGLPLVLMLVWILCMLVAETSAETPNKRSKLPNDILRIINPTLIKEKIIGIKDVDEGEFVRQLAQELELIHRESIKNITSNQNKIKFQGITNQRMQHKNVRLRRQSNFEDIKKTGKEKEQGQPVFKEMGTYTQKKNEANSSIKDALNNETRSFSSYSTTLKTPVSSKDSRIIINKKEIDKRKEANADDSSIKNETKAGHTPQNQQAKDNQETGVNYRHNETVSRHGNMQINADTTEKIPQSPYRDSMLEKKTSELLPSKQLTTKESSSLPSLDVVDESMRVTKVAAKNDSSTVAESNIKQTNFQERWSKQPEDSNKNNRTYQKKLTSSIPTSLEKVEVPVKGNENQIKKFTNITVQANMDPKRTETKDKTVNTNKNISKNEYIKNTDKSRNEVIQSEPESEIIDHHKIKYKNKAFEKLKPKTKPSHFSEAFPQLETELNNKNDILGVTDEVNSKKVMNEISGDAPPDQKTNDNDKMDDDVDDDVGDVNNDDDLSANETIHENASPKPEKPCRKCLKNMLSEEVVKNSRMNAFKEELISRLGLNQDDTAKNSMVGKAMDTEGLQSDSALETPNFPPWIFDEIDRLNKEEMEKDEFYAKDESVFILGEDMTDCIKTNSTGCFSFDLFNKIKSDVAEAQLWFYKSKDFYDKKGQTINVYDLKHHKNGSLLRYSNVTTYKTSLGNAWATVNVTQAVLKWMDLKMSNPMLAVQCSTCQNKNHSSLFQFHEYKPVLLVKYYKSNKVLRSKRSTTCDPTSECCKRDLEVNFHALGLHSVFYPTNLSIGYCYGDCNSITEVTYKHTSLIQRYRSLVADQPSLRDQLKPCCVPLVLKDMMMLVIENRTCTTKTIPKVIVESCGCL